jgi:hypothetical protein
VDPVAAAVLKFSGGSVSYVATGAPLDPEGVVYANGKARCAAAGPASQTPGDTPMIRKTTLFVATMFAAGTAFAFHCPQDMKKIDDAMAKNPKLTAAQTDEVKKYRAEGETLHKAGKHQESVDTLAKAMKILDIK